MSSGKYTAMSFSFNSFASLPIYMLQSSRSLCVQCLQLVFDLSLSSSRKLFILRDFTVHFDILGFLNSRFFMALNLFTHPSIQIHTYTCMYV